MIKENNVNAVVQAYNEFAEDPTLIFACSVNHAKAIAEAIPDAVAVFGSTPKIERKRIIEDFKAGKIPVLVNCQIFTEGTDLPNIKSIIMAAPTQSETKYQQEVGRGLRLYPDKEKLKLIDVIRITQCRKLCTAPVLLGLDSSLVPDYLRSNIQGDLFDLEEKINLNSDVFDNWIRSAELVDIWANEVELDTHDINFTRMPDGSLKVLNYTIPAPDALGKSNNYTMQYYIDRIYDKLMLEHQDKAMLWDLNLIRYWKNEPATDKQKRFKKEDFTLIRINHKELIQDVLYLENRLIMKYLLINTIGALMLKNVIKLNGKLKTLN